jgi:hypothetical protein
MKQKHFYKFLFVFAAVLFATVCAAQKTKVYGKVFDSKTKEALPFVNVFFKDSKIGTTTNFDGEYTLESYYATDYIAASCVGYEQGSIKIEKDVSQEINLFLNSSSIDLQEVQIVASKKQENPAHRIIRKVIANKKINDRKKLEAYEYEVYNKVQFDMNNVTEKFKERRAFKKFDFIFDNIDTVGGKPYLPFFMTESLSNYYYRKNPKASYETINAAKVSGLENQSISQFLGDMYQNVNIYDNNVNVFGKQFASPVSDAGFFYYKYYLIDSLTVDDTWCYHIRFLPKREQDAAFTGDLFIADTTYAIKKGTASIAKKANINFINSFTVTQEFKQVQPEVWMLIKDELLVDFNLSKQTMGFYGRKTTSYKNHIINKPREKSFYSNVSNISVADSANEKSAEYWNNARHEDLSKQEKSVYLMVDSLTDVPIFKTYIDVIELFFSGYKKVGPIEIGSYSKLYSFNPIEGNRVRLGVRTSSKFSTRIALDAWTAYGFRDEKLKYGGGVFYYLSKRKPRISIDLHYSLNTQQLGMSPTSLSQDDVFGTLFQRNPITKLSLVDDLKFTYNHEWFHGFSNALTFRKREFTPLGSLEFKRFETESRSLAPVPKIKTTEFSLYTRFAYKEKYLAGEFNRISLGTKYPTIELLYTKAFKSEFGDYDYQKLDISISDKIRLGYFGTLNCVLTAGQIFGEAPFPLLEIHRGNESFYYDGGAFNTMNFFEFISDKYISASVTQHFDGLFFNKIPLFRRLKWREVAELKGVYGTFNPKHKNLLVLNEGMNTFQNNKPFVEAAVGIENIFKFIRIDALYRLSYLNNPNIVKFGIRAKFQFKF